MCQQRKTLWVVLFTALSLGLASPSVAAGPELQVELEGKVRLTDDGETDWVPLADGQAVAPGGQILYTVRLTDDGETDWVPLADGQAVAPGGQILYTVRLTNTGDTEARRPQAIGPVPVGTVYVENTAPSVDGVIVAYSIDGGKTFSAKPVMVVTAPDGTTHTVPAPLDRYTTIQWNWDSSLAAGTQQAVSYQVQVR